MSEQAAVENLIERLRKIERAARGRQRKAMAAVSLRWLEMVARGESAPLPTPILIERTRATWNLW